MDEKSLRSLKADLTRQKQQVRARIVHAVNHHYPKYQAVVSTLIGTREQLARAGDPLKVLEDDVQLLEASATEEHAGFAQKVAELERVRHHKKLLLFFIDAHRKITWLETQIGLPNTLDEDNSDAPRHRTITTDDPDSALVVTDIVRLEQLTLFHALLRASLDSHTQNYPFLASLSTRLDLAGAIFERSAHYHLTQALDTFRSTSHIDEPTFQSCARIYQYLDAYSQLIVSYITTQIDPVLLSARSSARQLPTYLRTVHDQLHAGPLMLLTTIRAASPPSLSASLAHHIVLRLIEALDTGLAASHYSASVPSAFHRNYSAVTSFFRDMLVTLHLADQAAEMPELAALMRRWPVETFFQLISRQIASEVEANAAEGKAVAAAFAKLSELWVPAVAHRFFKLAVQVIRRYHVALLSAVDLPGEEAGTAETKVRAMVSLDETHAAVEASALVSSTHALIRQGLVPVLANGRAQLFAKWQAGITSELADNANQVLRLTRSIAAQYRATGRPAPSLPSSFIPVVFKSMTDLIALAPQLESDVWSVVVPEVVSSALATYTAVVEDLLATLKKTEESLRRLKQAKSSRASGGGSGSHVNNAGAHVNNAGGSMAMSDEDKIRAQIGLDVTGLEKVVAELPCIGGEERAREMMRSVREVVAQHS